MLIIKNSFNVVNVSDSIEIMFIGSESVVFIFCLFSGDKFSNLI